MASLGNNSQHTLSPHPTTPSKQARNSKQVATSITTTTTTLHLILPLSMTMDSSGRPVEVLGRTTIADVDIKSHTFQCISWDDDYILF